MSLSPSTQKAGGRDHLSPVQEKPGYRARVLGGGGGKEGLGERTQGKKKALSGDPNTVLHKVRLHKNSIHKESPAPPVYPLVPFGVKYLGLRAE